MIVPFGHGGTRETCRGLSAHCPTLKLNGHSVTRALISTTTTNMDPSKLTKSVLLSSRLRQQLSDACNRKRKLTDKAIPNVLLENPAFAQDSKMYQELLETERKLDWTMTRKRLEIQDALSRAPTVCNPRPYTKRRLHEDADDAHPQDILEPYRLRPGLANWRRAINDKL